MVVIVYITFGVWLCMRKLFRSENMKSQIFTLMS